MNIISRYIVRQFLPIFTLALVTFLALYLIIDFFEKIDNMMAKNVSASHIAAYFLYKIPSIVTQGIPMASLLATLIALGILKRNRELTALEAAGINPTKYITPIVACTLLLSFIHFGLSETVSRPMNQKSQKIWQQEVRQNKASMSYIQENVWYRGKGVIYQIHLYDRIQKTMEKVTLFYLDSQFRLTERLDAMRFRWENQRWMAEDGLLLRFEGDETVQEQFQQRALDLKETPQDFEGLETMPEELNWGDLYKYSKRIRLEGYNSTPYEVELHMRLAFPLTTLILALLGITIAMRQGMHAGITLSVGIALIVAFLYLTVLQLGSGLATASILPPALGVWASNVIFTCFTVYLWMTKR
ncbi:LPS export ABC transporter permease LptG [Desulforhabdus sp. TSK]|uniref:LPS export ABC transporter permease LptG n=1 Tax=Desulforhabdus sp. TSK TaxID=2925014 RepID=UPI001FC857A8|nr:LPS export ABC transporter permease LptG [Desulforhabdus sp. TSK]GKT08183.1 LPS export ABC transporter permease LptG [Desulforhabdus sp. TSK]